MKITNYFSSKNNFRKQSAPKTAERIESNKNQFIYTI